MMAESKVLLQCLEQLEIGNTKTLPSWSNSKRKRKNQKKLPRRHLPKQDHIVILKRVKSIR